MIAPFWGLNADGVSSNEGPLYPSDPWDSFSINGQQVACDKAWIQGKSIAGIEVEKKKGKGSAGATITFYGYEPGEFDVVFQISTDEQWDAFQVIKNHYWAGPSKTAKPPQLTVLVSHADLIYMNISQAVLIGVLPSEKAEIEGAKNFRWKFHERVDVSTKNKTKTAEGPLPDQDNRLPAANAPLPLPSSTPANMSLAGPKLGGL